ncbi:hypothetical protein [Chromohalobacter israelensis]|uniref:hypothetical protein n=1 Tax=Chromohalobacter israelensis TaxID=141390 RepID=UPI001CC47AB3|nr:hypothetical protein [Chromohalobacter salexigens]MBZ5876649.1 hypothetical protein [Chromohalobacter salexigens]
MVFLGYPFFVRLVNVFLRGSTLASKFLLLFSLAYFLEPEKVGLYGVFFAAVSYSIYLVGFEFYIYSTRDMIPKGQGEWGRIIKSHGAFSLVGGVVSLPFFLLLFYANILPFSFFAWFLLILFFEYLGQEFNRLFVAASKQLTASLILFLRSGLWSLTVVALMLFFESLRNLEFVLGAWLACGVATSLCSILILKQMRLGGWKDKVDWKWIKRGVVVAAPFLLASLSVRGMFTFDRVLVEHLSSLSVVGAYALFVGMANALVSFLDSAVFVFLYPSLIRHFNDGDASLFKACMSRMLFQTLVVVLLFSVVSVSLVGVVVNYLGKEVYLTYEYMYYYLLVAVILFSIGTVFQYGLYAQGKDKHIVISNVFSFFAFLGICFSLAPYLNSLAVPVSLCCAFGIALIWKAFVYIKYTPYGGILRLGSNKEEVK